MKKRIVWIDTARGLCIFLVVLGHTILPYSWLIYIFSFHMPLFFFLSGYVYNPEKYKNLWLFIKQKALTLLWPYLIFFLIGYVYWVLFFNSKDYFYPFYQMLYSSDKLTAPFIPLWFLTCLFVLNIIFFILQKYLKPWVLAIAVLACTVFGFYLARHNYHLAWGFDIALVAMIFYWLGFIIKSHQNILKQLKLPWFYLVGLVLLVINFFLALNLNVQASMIYRIYGREWVFVLAATSGTLGWLAFARFLKRTVFARTGVWEFLGQNSLIILGLHTIFYYYVSDFFHYTLNIYPQVSLFYSFVFTVITLLVMTPFIYLINKKLPFLLGRN